MFRIDGVFSPFPVQVHHRLQMLPSSNTRNIYIFVVFISWLDLQHVFTTLVFTEMMSSIKSFTLELDGEPDAAFTGGEVVSGQVVLELRRDTRVVSMKVQGRGVATAHWLENRGMNSVYNDYTSKIAYFRKRQHLIRG